MATEIERKFLILHDGWRAQADSGIHYRQGYMMNSAAGVSVRVRCGGGQGYINFKSATLGISRREYDYPIPETDAQEMLDLFCVPPLIEKTRYHVRYGAHVWEVDVFAGDNAGLVVAEIELAHEDESYARPDWLGAEVSHDPRYYNSCLVKNPYKYWRSAG